MHFVPFLRVLIFNVCWLSTQHIHGNHTSQGMSNNMTSSLLLQKVWIASTKDFPYTICLGYDSLQDLLFVAGEIIWNIQHDILNQISDNRDAFGLQILDRKDVGLQEAGSGGRHSRKRGTGAGVGRSVKVEGEPGSPIYRENAGAKLLSDIDLNEFVFSFVVEMGSEAVDCMCECE